MGGGSWTGLQKEKTPAGLTSKDGNESIGHGSTGQESIQTIEKGKGYYV